MSTHGEGAVRPTEVVVHRPWRWASAVVLALAVGNGVVVTVETPHPTGFLVFFGAVGLLAAASAVLSVRGGITAGADGVVARTEWGSTRRVAWADVHHFAARGGNWHGLGVWTMDGRWVSMLRYGLFDVRAYGWAVDLDNFRWERQQALGLVHVEP